MKVTFFEEISCEVCEYNGINQFGKGYELLTEECEGVINCVTVCESCKSKIDSGELKVEELEM